MTKYKNPEVKVLNKFDERIEAWRISRPYLDPNDINLEELTKMDLAVNGAASYSFYFRSSLLFRDLLFSVRPAIGVWARSQRTISFDEDNLFLSGEYENIDDKWFQSKMDTMYDHLRSGTPQDFAKKELPMAVSTEFSITIDDRTLVSFLKMLKLHCPSLYNVYGRLILDSIGVSESYVDNRNCKDIFNKLKISESEYAAVGSTFQCMEMFMGSFRMSSNLMSQFIRQHYSTVKNELYNIIDGKSLNDLYKLSCDDPVVVALYADKESFEKVISVRSCFFGQWDKEDISSWSSIIGAYVKDMSPKEFLSILPCKGNCNNCGIEKDMKPRMEGIEVNPVCPILVQKPSIVKARGAKYKSDSVIYEKWVELVNSGLIKDNKDNEKRKIYEHMLQGKDDNSEWGMFKNLD